MTIYFFIPIGGVIIGILLLIAAGIATVSGKIYWHLRDYRNAKKVGVSLEEYRSNRMYYLLKGGKRG